MRDFRNLKVWEKSHKLALDVYKVTDKLPNEERFGLVSQIRRSGYSIPTNIAEGCGRESERELARYLNISMGSASELEYLLLLVKDLDYISEDAYSDVTQRVIEVKRMLTSFIKKLKADS